MGDVVLGTDLFGDPVLAARGGPGRPEIVWNRETSSRVLLAFARGLTVKETAEIAGMSSPTMRRVYFSECAKRTTALLRLEMTQLVRLNAEAEKGNVGAERELARRLDQVRMRDSAKKQASAPPSKASPKLGKKEEAEMAARKLTGLYDPPAAPLLN